MGALFRPRTPMHRRLLGRLHRVYDREPGAVLALRIRSTGGLTWKVADRVLTVTRPGRADLAVALEQMTIAGLRDLLVNEGLLEFSADDPGILTLGAMALIDGSGDQDVSNGDHLYVFTTELWAWATAVGRWLDAARSDIRQMLRQMIVPQSEGEWSDLWASYFGLYRRSGESDARLNFRTTYEWRRPRSNPIALQLNHEKLLGAKTWIREPWKEMWTLGEADLSGAYHLPNDAEFSYHRAQVRSYDAVDWEAVMREVEADRPAGTLFLDPIRQIGAGISTGLDGRSLGAGVTTVDSRDVRDLDPGVLDVSLALSATTVALSPSFSIFQLVTSAAGPLANPGNLGRPRVFALGSIVLSEQHPLGTLQAHLPGRQLVETGGPMALSGDDGLSDSAWTFGWAPIDLWLDAMVSVGAVGPFTFPAQGRGGPVMVSGGLALPGLTPAAPGGIRTRIGLALPIFYQENWQGSWDDRSWEDASGTFPMPTVSCRYTTEVLYATITGSGAVTPNTMRATLATAIRLKATAAAQAQGQAVLSTRILLASKMHDDASMPAAYANSASIPANSGRIQANQEQTGVAVRSANAGTPANSGRPANATYTLAPVTSDDAGLSVGRASATGRIAPAAQLVATVSAAASAGADLTTRIALAATAAGQATRVGAALVTGIKAKATAAAVASRVNAALTTAVRMKASVAAVATQTSTASNAGPPNWPTANRTWLLDPDVASTVGLDSNGRVQQLTAVGDSSRYLLEDDQYSRGRIITAHGRGMLNLTNDQAGALEDPTNWLRNEMAAARTAQTYSVVWMAPSDISGPSRVFLAAFDDGATTPLHMLYLTGNGDQTTRIAATRRTDSGTEYTTYSRYVSFTAGQVYLLTWRYNADGTVSIFRDNEDLNSGTGYATSTFPASTTLGTDYAAMGYANLGSEGILFSTGSVGAQMRFSTALTTAEIATMVDTKNKRYP